MIGFAFLKTYLYVTEEAVAIWAATSTNQLSTTYEKRPDGLFKLGRRLAAFDISLMMIGSRMNGDASDDVERYIFQISDRYTLGGCICPDHTANRKFEDQEIRSSVYFVLVSSNESFYLLACSAAQMNVYHPMATEKVLSCSDWSRGGTQRFQSLSNVGTCSTGDEAVVTVMIYGRTCIWFLRATVWTMRRH